LINFLGPTLAQEFFGTDIGEVIERTTRGPNCSLAGFSCVWDAIWEHKNLIAGGVCIAASMGWCGAAVLAAFAGTEYDLIRSGAPVKEHVSNALVSLLSFSVGAAGSAGVGASQALNLAERALVKFITNLGGAAYAACQDLGECS
jgi:hypothetical protein